VLFNSVQFAIFFIVVYTLYLILDRTWQNRMLLVASCIFYGAWSWKFLLLLFVSVTTDYLCAGYIYRTTEQHWRKTALVINLLVNLGILAFFKYFNFFIANLQELLSFFGISIGNDILHVVLPVGISFYTFQAMSYSIDVYRKQLIPARNYWDYALFVVFFPQLVAGPIERARNLLPQFQKTRSLDYRTVTDGFKLIVWGLFKKIVIADRLAVLVNVVYREPLNYGGPVLVLATFFFAFQIYCDFSGYSDMAIGLAQVMGFKLMDNFNRPYFSKSVSEFWKRWHISLSTWFKDYVYVSLGGDRVSKVRWHANIMITFLLSGLWHGANWTYVVWGGLNGMYVLGDRFIHGLKETAFSLPRLKYPDVIRTWARVVITFSLICFAWIFFRSATLSDAFYIATHLHTGWGGFFSRQGVQSIWVSFLKLGLNQRELITAIVSVCFMECIHCVQRHGSIRHMLAGKPAVVRWSVYFLLVNSIFILGVTQEKQFIYFQF